MAMLKTVLNQPTMNKSGTIIIQYLRPVKIINRRYTLTEIAGQPNKITLKPINKN